MSKQTIGTGTSNNDGTGDTVRTAFTKSNSNFTELYNRPYVIGFFAGGDFADGEVFFRHTIGENATLRFYDSDGQASPLPDPGTAPKFTVETKDPSVERVFSITLDNVEVGTVTFAADSYVGVAAFDGGTAGYFDAVLDSEIRVVAPNPVGATIAGLSVTLLGFRE